MEQQYDGKMCEECGINPANVHITQIMNNETTLFHLCEECAGKKGISISIDQGATPLSEKTAPSDGDTVQDTPDVLCPACGMALSSFQKNGWLGCARCYDSFSDEIERLLVEIQGSATHKGKTCGHTGPKTTIETTDVDQLRRRLRRAIDTEKFEEAARLRDTIRELLAQEQ